MQPQHLNESIGYNDFSSYIIRSNLARTSTYTTPKSILEVANSLSIQPNPSENKHNHKASLWKKANNWSKDHIQLLLMTPMNRNWWKNGRNSSNCCKGTHRREILVPSSKTRVCCENFLEDLHATLIRLGGASIHLPGKRREENGLLGVIILFLVRGRWGSKKMICSILWGRWKFYYGVLFFYFSMMFLLWVSRPLNVMSFDKSHL